MIGKRLAIGAVSEVLPVAPRPDVLAPLLMERLLPEVRTPELHAHAEQFAERVARLGPSWQRLVDAQFTGMESHFLYERFVGVTLRDVSIGLRKSRRVLPLDVLRGVIDRICDAFADVAQLRPLATPTPWHWLGVTDRGLGLSLEGRWCFAIGALNHWLGELGPSNEWSSNDDGPLPQDTLSFLSPEAASARDETPASFVTRAALMAWQLATGGFHPFRGRPHETGSDFIRFSQGSVRVPLTVNPTLSPELFDILTRGIAWSADRFEDLTAFRAALDAAWTQPAATPERTLAVLASVAWARMETELEALKREPMLPIQWAGVWSATQSPEAGIAVLQDQLLERLEPVENLPKRSELPPTAGPLPEPLPPPPPPAPRAAMPPAPTPVPLPTPPRAAPPVPSPRPTPSYVVPPPRRSLLQRLLDFFRG